MKKYVALAFAAFVAFASSSVDAKADAIGPKFLVSKKGLGDPSSEPSIAAFKTGGFIVVYNFFDNGKSFVTGRRVSASGKPIGNSFRISGANEPIFALEISVAARTKTSGFVVTWNCSKIVG